MYKLPTTLLTSSTERGTRKTSHAVDPFKKRPEKTKPASHIARAEPAPSIEPGVQRYLLRQLRPVIPDLAVRKAFVVPVHLCLQKTEPNAHMAFIHEVLPDLIRDLSNRFPNDAPWALTLLAELKRDEKPSNYRRYPSERWESIRDRLREYVTNLQENEKHLITFNKLPPDEAYAITHPSKVVFKQIMQHLLSGHGNFEFPTRTSPPS